MSFALMNRTLCKFCFDSSKRNLETCNVAKNRLLQRAGEQSEVFIPVEERMAQPYKEKKISKSSKHVSNY